MAVRALQQDGIMWGYLVEVPARWKHRRLPECFDPATTLASMWLLGISLGILFASPALLPWALLVLLTFAAFNLLLMQMVFAWVERWLAQRRTREIMGILFILLMLSFQLIGPLMERYGGKHARPGFQRFIEIWTSIPSLYLLLIISSVLVPGFFVLLGILLLFSWVSLVGLVRAEFLRGRNFEYIQAARALGVSNAVIIFRHLLPNAMVATMTFLPFILSSSVMTLTALDFLGFGLPPGSPSLGELLSQGKANVQAPWLGFTGFFSIALMLSLLIFIGEAVRDAFDPRKTFR